MPRTPDESTPLRAATAPRRRRAASVAAMAAMAAVALVVVLFSARTRLSIASTSSNATNADWFCHERDFETDYITLRNKQDDRYFYWFVRSRSATRDTDPLVIWLNGGPGASSLEGLLTENGPCLVQPDGSTVSNAYAWNNRAHVIWLEQPSGVGFSYFTADADRDATGEDVGLNMIAFLEGFLGKHPEFEGRALYLTGESYAGHYIPAAAYAIWRKNKALGEHEARRLNLQGVAIGNGAINLKVQYFHSADMAITNAYNLTLLNTSQIAQMQQDSDECFELLRDCVPNVEGPTGCQDIANACSDKMLNPFLPARRNLYDIRQPCVSDDDCQDADGGVVAAFLASDAVRKGMFPTLGGRAWVGDGGYVRSAYLSSGDWARGYEPEIEQLLDAGLRVLIFAGDADLECNWIGNHALTFNLDWQSKIEFQAATEVAFVTPKDPLGPQADLTPVHAGTVRQFENLAFVRLFNAGHLVPRTQPVTSWVMLDRFLNNEQL